MDKPPVADKPKPPIQRQDYDLTQPPRISDNPPKTRNTKAELRNPAEMMRDLGFCPTSSMTPLQFLVAVMNDDADALFRQEKKRNMMKGKGIGMNYRLEAAKTAAKYFHMAQPQINIQAQSESKFADELQQAISKGDMRVEKQTVILETVERISPDTPIAGASYPPAFAHIQEDVIEHDIDAEGDTDYDPDRDD